MIDPADLFRLHRHKSGIRHRRCIVQCKESVDHRQAILAAEIEIALVVRGASENRAGAVIHEDKVGDPDRQVPIGVQRVLHGQAGVKAQLLGLFQRLFGGAALGALGAEGGDLGVLLGQCLGQRVIRRNADERRAHQRVGAGGINVDPLVALGGRDHVEGHLKPARFADPVGLHQLDLGGPVIEAINGGQQFLREIADFEEPLRQLAPLDIRARAPALAVDHLFVGQNGHVDRIPVDHGVLAIDEARLEHIEEQRLLLAVIFGIAGRLLARPVERPAQGLHLRLHHFDVLIGPVLRVPARGHGRVFRGHPEGVPAHRVKHVKAVGDLVAGDHVAHRIVPHVPHMQPPRRIGEHLEHIVFRFVRGSGGAENAGLIPGSLPFGFDIVGGIAGHILVFQDSETPGFGARRSVNRVFGRIL